MLLRNRAVGIRPAPDGVSPGLEHLTAEWLVLLRWLDDNEVQYVLVGAAAQAIRGDRDASGPVAIVPAPFARNLQRLSRALWAARARQRAARALVDDASDAGGVPVRLTVQELAQGQRWKLQCGGHDLDIESHPSGVPGYQELVYDADRVLVTEELVVEVAGPERLQREATPGLQSVR